MPELTCSLLVGPAISEPVQLADGRIVFAAETPARDAIRVVQIDPPHQVPLGVRTAIVATLPGGSTGDNGTRAQWPRMAVLADGYTVAYQYGLVNKWKSFNGSGASGSGWLSHGTWPVAVKSAGERYEASQLSGSQGVFGYFAGRWWTYDEMRESGHQQDWVRLGTLSHAWNDREWRFFLYKHESGTVWRAEGPGASGMPMRVFTGQAEYPRGCTLADGRILVTAVGPRVREVSPGVWEHQLRVAVSPFDKFESEEPVATRIRVLEWGPGEGLVAPAHTSAVVEIDGSSRYFKHIRPLGQTDWITEERAMTDLALEHFYVRDPGAYEFKFSLASGGAETSIRRFTVSAPPAPEPPPTQVVTLDEALAIVTLNRRITLIAEDLSYTVAQNARCAGLDSRAALIAYRDAVSAAIAQLEVG